MQLSEKQETFLEFHNFQICIKFWTFSKEDDTHRWCISEIMHSKNVFK